MNINEIAKLAGVSKGTVSRVLNGGTVKKETRIKVLKIIDENNYVPSTIARNLYLRKTFKILVVIPSFSNPFYFRVIEGISKILNDNNYSMLLFESQSKNNKLEFVDFLKDNTVDGAIVLENLSSETINDPIFIDNKFPIVQCSEYSENAVFPFVTIDNYLASVEATSYLIEIGCKKLYYINSMSDFTFSKRRKNGFIDACKSNNVPFDVIETTLDSDGGFKIFNELIIEEDKVGVFCISDMVAFGVMKAAIKNKIKIGDNLAIIGFDNIDLCHIITPELTTISQEMDALGECSAKMLLDIINGKSSNTRVILKHKLIKRETT